MDLDPSCLTIPVSGISSSLPRVQRLAETESLMAAGLPTVPCASERAPYRLKANYGGRWNLKPKEKMLENLSRSGSVCKERKELRFRVQDKGSSGLKTSALFPLHRLVVGVAGACSEGAALFAGDGLWGEAGSGGQ